MTGRMILMAACIPEQPVPKYDDRMTIDGIEYRVSMVEILDDVRIYRQINETRLGRSAAVWLKEIPK